MSREIASDEVVNDNYDSDNRDVCRIFVLTLSKSLISISRDMTVLLDIESSL